MERQIHPAEPVTFDWSQLYYIGRKVIGLTEEEFWDSSMEKINDLAEVHVAMQDEKAAKRRKKKLARGKAEAVGLVPIDKVSFF
ncbi:hypothetical protein [Enterococcus phage vB_EfaS_140]|uniref:Uncharacterized protein n=1 Tax=Enterococcus phage vB_EfaS_140 TaxID=2730536 RepID=A0ACA9AS95_9CAUD|nr:hypothetical protein [Enterococcus phage vB_EfaS_140]